MTFKVAEKTFQEKESKRNRENKEFISKNETFDIFSNTQINS